MDGEDAGSQSGNGRAKRRRAARACEFCKRRKMKCDDATPKCTNCKLYGKDCQYAENPRKIRSKRDQFNASEEDNGPTQIERSTSSPASHVASDVVRNVIHNSPSPGRALPQTSHPKSPTRSNIFEADDETLSKEPNSTSISTAQAVVNHSSYYGRTSALFDEDSSDGKVQWVKRQAVENTKRQLLGEAAYQKQLETINYQAGKLDFDGIEPEVGMHLLNLHWNRQHHSHLITYRPVFMRDMACQGPYFSKLLLNAIYFGSCKFSPRPELKNFHIRFRQRVREILGGALDKSTITTIQAMLVMTNSLFALGDERSAAWTYAGIAFRMLIDLGAHMDGMNSRLSDEELEIRRRVFWGAFVVDKIQSLYQGRPVSIRYCDIKVPILFLDQFEELEPWTPFAYPDTKSYSGSPAYSVSTFAELCKLSVIMNSILDKVYGVQSSKQEPNSLIKELDATQRDLDEWKAGLPPHLNYDPLAKDEAPPPHVLSLLAMYNVMLILLHRPFVSEGHLHSTSTSIATSSFSVCAQAATRTVHLLRVYERTFSIRHAPYLIAYATYVAATIHVRIAAQLGPGSDAYGLLRTCCSVFAKNQATNWAARRAQAVIISLMKKMNIELTVNDEPTPDPRVHGSNLSPLNSNNNAGETRPNLNHTHASATSSDPADITQLGSVGELDINLIIHSFVSEQQVSTMDGVPHDFQYPQHIQHFNQNSSHVPQSEMYGQWGGFEFPTDEEFGDTLFGFNGPALDGMWQ